MILLPRATSLSGIERYGLDLLVDLSRLLPASPDVITDAVRLEITDGGPPSPTLAGCVEAGWYFSKSDGVVAVPREVLGVIGHTVGAVAEQRSTARDRHGRVPPGENAVAAAGLEGGAAISRAAKSLREAAAAVASRRPYRLLAPWPDGRRWAAVMTHDLDLVAWWPLAVAARVVELARKGKPGMALHALASSVGAIGRNPVWRGIQSLLRAEGDFSARSTWFVICETPTLRTMAASDVTYQPESPPARRILRDLTTRGYEVGLHGSFATSTSAGLFEQQRERLAALTGGPPAGVRQHFLRMRPGETHAKMAAAGFQYDSSLGFSDRNGFRLGVADVVPVWNEAAGEALELEEVPFCWMDRALSKYRAVEDPEAWVDEGLALASECRSVEGAWVGVWHPNMQPVLGFPGAADAFERLLGEIAAQHPFLGSLSTIVRWRKARRSVRAEALQPDGVVVARSTGLPGHALFLEDATGHRREAVGTPAE
jgi:hypothetical protein